MICCLLPLLSLAAILSPAQTDRPVAGSAAGSVAVVTRVEGSCQVRVATSTPRVLALFDWLDRGAVITPDKGAKVTLALLDGRRFEVTGEVTLQEDGLRGSEGSVRALEAVPALPRVVALAGPDVGRRSAAVRIRAAGQPLRLSPQNDDVTVHDHTVLRVQPEDGRRIRVEVEDEKGSVLFVQQTTARRIEVPPGILEPGRRYWWSVRTLDAFGPSAHAAADFTTLGPEDRARRQALRGHLEPTDDPLTLAFLAEIDHRLGLVEEALEDLERAVALCPPDLPLRARLEELRKALSP
jgi:hypothetical protein